MSYEAPFAGLKVVDLSQGIAGPYCAMLLAQHGAQVIKVEGIGDGDWARTIGTRYGSHTAFSIVGNLGKSSIAVDLKQEAGKEIVWRLLNNLKDIYVKGHAIDKCLSMVDMMLIVDSEDLIQFRDRGLLRMQLRQFDGAGRDLQYYLQHAPDAEDREEIENHVKELRRIRAMMN